MEQRYNDSGLEGLTDRSRRRIPQRPRSISMACLDQSAANLNSLADNVGNRWESLPAAVPARSAGAFLAHPTRFERVIIAFRALLPTPPAPCRAVAEARPIG